MRLMLGVTFIIAVAALVLHLRPIATPPLPAASSESFGARLQRECESVIDTADATVSAGEVWLELKDRPALREELRKVGSMREQIDYLKTKRPNVWQEAIRETVARTRAIMIRDCILQRGTKG